MTRPFPTRPLQFYLTAPAPCPYLSGRRERKVFAHLDANDGGALNEALTHAGFRRSQSVIYRPACEACDACLSARVLALDFSPSRSQRRVITRNADLIRESRPATATQEQFDLISAYLSARHADGGMAGMSFGDYAMMVADTPTRTRIIEYRAQADGPLTAATIVDSLSDGVSLVYSFFDPDADRGRSLGAFMIVDHILATQAAGLPHVYLGYWVEGSPKMAYKARYRPLEVLKPGGWRLLKDTA